MAARREVDIPMSSAAIFALLLLAYPACALAEAPKICAAPPTSTRAVNVKDKGAKGDGKTDDTAAIQSAIDDVAGANGTVFVPDGVYMVDAVRGKSLRLGSDMTFKLADNAVLKAFPNKSKNYAVLTIAEASNVWVTGGTLEGERDQHKGKSGEWGMGIHIGKNAKHITISSVAAKKMWGDGFYVDNAEDVRFCSILADGNRRQGLSIIDAKRLLVSNSVFKNTRGTRPSAGIDLEPDKPSQEITDIRIENSRFIDNAGAGILVAGKKARISRVEMTGNLFRGNRAIIVENAPGVAGAICDNRQTSTQAETAAGFNAYAEPIEIVALQNDCGESGFVLDRGVKKKKKQLN